MTEKSSICRSFSFIGCRSTLRDVDGRIFFASGYHTHAHLNNAYEAKNTSIKCIQSVTRGLVYCLVGVCYTNVITCIKAIDKTPQSINCLNKYLFIYLCIAKSTEASKITVYLLFYPLFNFIRYLIVLPIKTVGLFYLKIGMSCS